MRIDCRVCKGVETLERRERGLDASLFVCTQCNEAWVLENWPLERKGIRRSVSA